jgi:hypothetical protein
MGVVWGLLGGLLFLKGGDARLLSSASASETLATDT